MNGLNLPQLAAYMTEQSEGRLCELMESSDGLTRQQAAAEHIRRFRVDGYAEDRIKCEVGEDIWNLAYQSTA